MQKKLIILISTIVIITIIIFTFIFFKNNNKKLNSGNTLSNKNNQEIEEYILNISSYEATIKVNIEGNKNKTQYQIKQSYVAPNLAKQVVLEPSNIQGLETTYDGNNLTIKNTSLNLSTVYENYQGLTQNYLWLSTFIEDYKKSSNKKLYEENSYLIMESKADTENPYISSKKLFIDKTSGKITKMEIQNENQKNTVYILYNEIKINSLKQEEILAFSLKELSASQY